MDAVQASSTERLLVTGGGGVIGRTLRAGLADRWPVTAVDRRRHGDRQVRRADLRVLRSALRACAGHDVVIALAACSGVQTPWRDVHRTNLRITWNTLEAARRAGARRVILASSNNVTGGYELEEPYRSVLAGERDGLDPCGLVRIRPDDPVRPNGAYAVGKIADEAMARLFADRYDLSVLCLRIGTVLAGDRPQTRRHEATLLTHRDLVHLAECCISAPADVRYGTYYGVSANAWRIWDIDNARQDLGFDPVDDASRLPYDG